MASMRIPFIHAVVCTHAFAGVSSVVGPMILHGVHVLALVHAVASTLDVTGFPAVVGRKLKYS